MFTMPSSGDNDLDWFNCLNNNSSHLFTIPDMMESMLQPEEEDGFNLILFFAIFFLAPNKRALVSFSNAWKKVSNF